MKKEVYKHHVVLHPVPDAVEVTVEDGRMDIQICTDRRKYKHQHDFGTDGQQVGVMAVYAVKQKHDPSLYDIMHNLRMEEAGKFVYTECIHSDHGIDVFPTLSDILKYLEPDMWIEYNNIIMSGRLQYLRTDRWTMKHKHEPGTMGAIVINYSINKKDYNYGDRKHYSK